MNRIGLLLVGGLLLAGCGYSGPEHADRIKKEQAMVGAPKPQYIEVEKDGRLYILGYPESAEKFKKEGHLATSLTKIGAGPQKQTVIFQADKYYVEDYLQAEFAKKYGAK